MQSSLQSDLGYIREIKAFEDNVSIKIDRSYRITLNSSRGGKSPLKDYPRDPRSDLHYPPSARGADDASSG